MATKKNFYVNLLLDESGSMGHYMSKTLEGFNAYVDKLKGNKAPTFFTLTKFNSNSCKPSYVVKPIDKVPKLTVKNYCPAAVTPLYDAVGKTLSALDRKITRDKLTGTFLFVIMTDGYENASREYDRAQIFELIKEKQAKGWEFVFMGADMDAWGVASGLGISKDSTQSYASIDTVDTFQKLSGQTMSYSANPGKLRGSFFNQKAKTGT